MGDKDTSTSDEKMTLLTYHDVVEYLEQLQKSLGSFRSATQRRVYEYLQKFLFVDKDTVSEIISQLEALNIPRKIAIQIAYILPVLPEELNPFLTQLKQIGVKIENKDEFIAKILEITKPVWEKKKDLILSLRNLSLQQLKKFGEETKII